MASLLIFSYCLQLKITFSYKQDNVLLMDSPIALPKSIKNPTEIEGMKFANVSTMTTNVSSELHLYIFGSVFR